MSSLLRFVIQQREWERFLLSACRRLADKVVVLSKGSLSLAEAKRLVAETGLFGVGP